MFRINASLREHISTASSCLDSERKSPTSNVLTLVDDDRRQNNSTMARKRSSFVTRSTLQCASTRIPSETTAPVSDFDLCRMPCNEIHRRILYPYSVHSANYGWVATLSRPDPNHSNLIRHMRIQFPTEREARTFCKAYSPPKLHTVGDNCMLCLSKLKSTRRNCRNCGVIVCEHCSRRWGLGMVPKTYHTNNAAQSPLTVRVCKACDWLSNSFCMALLQGRYEDAISLYETGNVNLRSTFADIHKEAMFPIHCAVLGGNFKLVKWLVDAHCCPIVSQRAKFRRMKSIQTSASRTLMDLAMTGRPKVDILMYFVRKGLSIVDLKDPNLAPKTLENILKVGITIDLATNMQQYPVALIDPDIEMTESLCIDESISAVEDMCALCCEKQMDCVMSPCGHQICCTDCGQQLKTCPVCKVDCAALRIFRP